MRAELSRDRSADAGRGTGYHDDVRLARSVIVNSQDLPLSFALGIDQELSVLG